MITDFFIGFHSVTLFTWGSVFVIGILSKFFLSSMITRISGALLGACLFFIITNFGVWSLGSYGYTFGGLLMCFTLAIPFFAILISTFIYSGVIEEFISLNLTVLYQILKN